MKVMVMVKHTPAAEEAIVPNEEAFAIMGRYNEELVNAGIMLTGEGLLPSSKGARIEFGDGGATVTDGPFTEAKEVIGGFWLWEVRTFEEAVEWAKRCPTDPSNGLPLVLEIRRVAGADDFGDALTPELREQEAKLIERVREQQQA